mgnify:CR=1 FL=1
MGLASSIVPHMGDSTQQPRHGLEQQPLRSIVITVGISRISLRVAHVRLPVLTSLNSSSRVRGSSTCSTVARSSRVRPVGLATLVFFSSLLSDAPGAMADAMWHAHMDSNQSYGAACAELLGRKRKILHRRTPHFVGCGAKEGLLAKLFFSSNTLPKK